ncbi:MAG TPA: hypothetical protein PKE40_05010 [Arachnia sp.]|nr:hypothetical protein [Arachnia sp.]HMT85693.1 hypothetical protein [Arachnia sp.]
MDKNPKKLFTKRARNRYRRALEEVLSSLQSFGDTTLATSDLEDRDQARMYRKSARNLQKALFRVSDAEMEWSGVDSFWPDDSGFENQHLAEGDECDPSSPPEDREIVIMMRIDLEITDIEELRRQGQTAGCGPADARRSGVVGNIHALLPLMVDLLERELSPFADTRWAFGAVSAAKGERPAQDGTYDRTEVFEPVGDEDLRVFELRYAD